MALNYLECDISKRAKTAGIVGLSRSLIDTRLLFSEDSTYSVEHTPEKQTTEMSTLDGMILGHEARWRQRQETSSIRCSTRKKRGSEWPSDKACQKEEQSCLLLFFRLCAVMRIKPKTGCWNIDLGIPMRGLDMEGSQYWNGHLFGKRSAAARMDDIHLKAFATTEICSFHSTIGQGIWCKMPSLMFS